MTDTIEVKPSLTASIANAAAVRVPKGFAGATTDALSPAFIHCLLYGETGSMKTTTAAEFGGPSKTFILLTRSPEQLIPIRAGKYHYARCEDADSLLWAMTFPEKAADASGFPEWKDTEDRVLMIDDMTEGAAMLVDENSTREDGSDVKDGRQIYKGVNDDLRAVMKGLQRRRMHTIMTALAAVFASNIANEETIYPDMPKGARSIVTAEIEFGFFLKRETKKMVTSTDFVTFLKKDEKTGKMVPGKREIWAKQKIGKELVGRVPPVLMKEEAMDLRAVWNKITGAK